jgi:outer membrane biosynthesis protein TonB
MNMTPLARILSVLLIALLWQGVAHADLDRVRSAAEAGDAKAQLELGILFEYGFHYKDNEIPALTWYILSANQGNAKAARLRDALKAKMTEKEVQEAMEQAAQFKPTKPSAAPATEAPKQEQPSAASETMPAESAPATAPSAVPETTPPAPVETAPAPAVESTKESLPAQPATAPPAEETKPAETAPSATRPEAK